MAWVRLDERRALNAKLRKAGLAARGLDEAAICWSAQEESDGRITAEDVDMLAALHACKRPHSLVKALIDVGRWEPMKDADGTVTAYLIKDFLHYNPSRAELDEVRRQKREAGQKGGIRSGESRRQNRSGPETGAS